MFSVNSSLDESSMIRVSNLYKKLGIYNRTALKAENVPVVHPKAKKTSRRQTMFASDLPNIFSISAFNKAEPRKHSSCTEEELLGFAKSGLSRQATQKSRFISNWIQNLKKNKENSR